MTQQPPGDLRIAPWLRPLKGGEATKGTMMLTEKLLDAIAEYGEKCEAYGKWGERHRGSVSAPHERRITDARLKLIEAIIEEVAKRKGDR